VLQSTKDERVHASSTRKKETVHKGVKCDGQARGCASLVNVVRKALCVSDILDSREDASFVCKQRMEGVEWPF